MTLNELIADLQAFASETGSGDFPIFTFDGSITQVQKTLTEDGISYPIEKPNEVTLEIFTDG